MTGFNKVERYEPSRQGDMKLYKEWMTYDVNDWKRVSVWVKRTENSGWEHAVQQDGKHFINGTLSEPFDMSALLKSAFAISDAEATK